MFVNLCAFDVVDALYLLFADTYFSVLLCISAVYCNRLLAVIWVFKYSFASLCIVPSHN